MNKGEKVRVEKYVKVLLEDYNRWYLETVKKDGNCGGFSAENRLLQLSRDHLHLFKYTTGFISEWNHQRVIMTWGTVIEPTQYIVKK